ncbi:TPA: hypothetical protein ACQVMD_003441, partial [Serratia marcescens]
SSQLQGRSHEILFIQQSLLASISDTQFSDKGKYLEISSGLQARVIVFLDKKPLYQWAVAPLYDIKNSVVGRVDEGS